MTPSKNVNKFFETRERKKKKKSALSCFCLLLFPLSMKKISVNRYQRYYGGG